MIERYMTIPYVVGGRDPAVGLDCWGLVREVYRDQLGIELPEYGALSIDGLHAAARAIRRDEMGGEWVRTAEPQALDLVLMSGAVGHRRYGTHVGLHMADGSIMHTEDGTGVAVVGINHPTVRERIMGYYRHAKRHHHPDVADRV